MFGHKDKDKRWFLVKLQGYAVPEWEREQDKCHDVIRSFWSTSGLQPTRDFYLDPKGRNRCTVCCRTFARPQDLKPIERGQSKQTRTGIVDAITAKRKTQQKLLVTTSGQVECRSGTKSVTLKISGVYVRSWRGLDDRRQNKNSKVRKDSPHIWGNKELHKNLRMRMYKSSVCSILTYGSEA